MSISSGRFSPPVSFQADKSDDQPEVRWRPQAKSLVMRREKTGIFSSRRLTLRCYAVVCTPRTGHDSGNSVVRIEVAASGRITQDLVKCVVALS